MFALQVEDGLALHLVDETQAEAQFAAVAASRAYIGQHLGWARHYHSADDARAFIQSMRQAFAEGSVYATMIYHRGDLVGGISLHVRNKAAGKAELGYWLSEAAAGRGIMTKAVRALCDFAFGTLKLNRIIIRAATDNPRSAAIPQRLGFQREGILRQDEYLVDHFIDLELYAMLAADWQPVLPQPEFRWPLGDDLSLTLHEQRHADKVFACTAASREHLRPWLPWVDSTLTVADTAAFVQTALAQYAAGNGFQCIVWQGAEVAGGIGYHYLDYASLKTELGYWLGAPFTGRGLMTRAVRALTDYALRTLHLNRVEIVCAAGNQASRAVPERLGFVPEATLRQSTRAGQLLHDAVVYAMLARDWPASTGSARA
ncbi:MAG: GNAT family N-acetyltransferase [Anaerolineae bacterium]|jgi:ribosomal-protein-serine acetyltransferase|nr:GNAT family N-acetyltransferase [Anaerolineae bacterium]